MLLHGTHAGTVAPHSTQDLAARARVVGPPRTLPVVDDAVSALLLEGCGTSLPQPPRIRSLGHIPTPLQPHVHMRTYALLKSL
jgi:hypothetical protein